MTLQAIRDRVLRRLAAAGNVVASCLIVASFVAGPQVALANSQAARVKGAAALLRGDFQVAVDAYTAALSDTTLDKARRATVLNDRAVALVRLNRPELAIQDYNQAVQLFPEYAAVYNNRGNLLLTLDMPREAIKDFNRALVLAPGYAEAYNNRAGAQIRLGNGSAAVDDYTKAIKLLPSTPAPLSGRGRAHLVLGRPHAAIRDFSRAVKVDARFADGYRNRAEAKFGVAHYPEAIEDLSRAIAFDPKNSELYLLRGHAFLATEKNDLALKDFSAAVELAPQSAAVLQARGLSYALEQNIEASLADLNRAVELNPRSAVAFAYRGLAYARSEQIEVGERDIETALKLDEKSAAVMWAKGEVELIGGDQNEAIEDFREAINLDPSFRRATLALQRLGMADDTAIGDVVVKGLGIQDWQVVLSAGRYFATSRKYLRIRVPLELMGKGKPKLLEWKLQDKPFKGIGTLLFRTGTIRGVDGKSLVTEATAIIDTWQPGVVAIQPTRAGDRKARWTWGNGTIRVASVDGVTDEFAVRGARSGPSVAGTRSDRRRYRRSDENFGIWGNAWGQPPRAEQRIRKKKTVRRRRGRRKKKKSLFQMLFNP